jgi:hypothetical protein
MAALQHRISSRLLYSCIVVLLQSCVMNRGAWRWKKWQAAGRTLWNALVLARWQQEHALSS